MSTILERIQRLVTAGRVRVSHHGNEELQDDVINAGDAVDGLAAATPLEEYADSGRGPSVLVLEYDQAGRPIHVVWGIAYDRQQGPAVLVTAYRPSLEKWHPDYRTRR